MPPELAAPLAVFIAALAQVLLMWASWKWPRGWHQKRDDSERNEPDDEET